MKTVRSDATHYLIELRDAYMLKGTSRFVRDGLEGLLNGYDPGIIAKIQSTGEQVLSVLSKMAYGINDGVVYLEDSRRRVSELMVYMEGKIKEFGKKVPDPKDIALQADSMLRVLNNLHTHFQNESISKIEKLRDYFNSIMQSYDPKHMGVGNPRAYPGSPFEPRPEFWQLKKSFP